MIKNVGLTLIFFVKKSSKCGFSGVNSEFGRFWQKSDITCNFDKEPVFCKKNARFGQNGLSPLKIALWRVPLGISVAGDPWNPFEQPK